jgi:hypothetical protein
MIVAVLAPLLIAVSAQAPPSDYRPAEAEAYQQEPPADFDDEAAEASKPADEDAEAYPDDGGSNGFEDEVEPTPGEEAEETADALEERANEVEDEAVEDAEEEEEMVCRRVHYIDDFGRQRSRKSCTPR